MTQLESLGTEALWRIERSAGERLSLFNFELGQYERSMGMVPVVGAYCSDDDCRHGR